jgi:hypothetical protein
MEKATINVIGQTLRRQLGAPETNDSTELRRLIALLERRERDREHDPSQPRPH